MTVERRTFWLSFSDASLPKGSQFLGVCLIDVDEQAAAAAKDSLREMFPNRKQLRGSEWIAAAIRIAHAQGCNAGGEVATMEVPSTFVGPRNRLMQRAELETLQSLQPPAGADTEHDVQ